MRPAPRSPSAHELVAVARAISEGGMGAPTFDQAFADLQEASLVVFDHYMTDGPGYIGRVAVVVWNGSPGFVDTFTFRSSAFDASAQVAGGTAFGNGVGT